MKGIPVAINEIPKVLNLYLACSPKLDLDYRFLPRAGGYLDQDYETMMQFNIIENRVREILARQGKEWENKMKNKGKR